MNRQELSFEMGSRLKSLREEKHLSYQELADALLDKYGIKISKDSLRDYEICSDYRSKAKSLPNLGMRTEYLIALSDFYEVSTDYLLCKTDCLAPEIETREICDQTGLSERAIRLLQDGRDSNDFVSLLIDNLLYALNSYQSAARFAAYYFIQAELSSSEQDKEKAYVEELLSLIGITDILSADDKLSTFVKIPVKSAAEFYSSYAVKKIEEIVLQTIKEYKDELKEAVTDARNLPYESRKELDIWRKASVLAAYHAMKDIFPNNNPEPNGSENAEHNPTKK